MCGVFVGWLAAGVDVRELLCVAVLISGGGEMVRLLSLPLSLSICW